MQQQWKCPTCGAMNVEDAQRCRICRLMPLTAAGAPAIPAPVRPVPRLPGPPGPPGPPMPPSPGPPMPPSPGPPISPATGLPPPGGWQDHFDTEPPWMSSPPPPPTNYPPPPPGWYPGAPPPGRKRRVWPIVVGIAVIVVVLIGAGIFFLRATDPEAAADRDFADAALLTNHDLGGTFSEVEHRTFARSRGGLRVEGGFEGCTSANNVLEDDGQAVVDSTLQAQSGISIQVVAEEIIVMGSPASATPLVDAISGTARSCLSAAVRETGTNASISISPVGAPDLGDRAVAYRGSIGAPGGQVALDVNFVVVQQGRAVVMLLALDTTGSFQARLESLANTTLMRLAPRFGT